MSTILLTGASGTLGREIAKRLAGSGAPARLALRDPYRLVEGAGALERVRFDFHDPSGFPEALRGVDRVFLLRPPRLADIRRDFDPFLLAMLQADVERVVFLSVRGAERNPLLPHRRIEKLLERSGLAWTHLRPNDWMQNFATVHRDDIRRGELWAPAGRGRTSFVDARDVAEAAAEVLTGQGHERRAYPLTGAEELDLYEAAAVLSETIGRPVAYRNPGVLAFLRHVRATGRPLSLGLVMTGVYTIARLGLASGTTPDLRRLIGRPPTTLRAFAEDHAAVWR
ncbi:SDR family oxidoreductase [Craurococcus roseus]|uniref:SDR family oxidoreductase n=1 Tax=Craurococcus roseus TaxID=77585 RepID=A0ABN1ELM0_9PROT